MSMIAVAGVAALLAQSSGQDMLAKHVATLSSAKSLTVTYTVQQIPAAPEDYKLVFNKPNMLRIESPSGIIQTDGKTIWEYIKSSNEYTELPGDMKTMMGYVNKPEVYAWAAFFMPDQFKGVKDASTGKKMTMKGASVTEVNFTISSMKNLTGTLYFDPVLGAARGASMKASRGGDSVETLLKARDIQISDKDADTGLFTFSAPAGAKKVEVSAGDLAKWYHDLDEGMKVAKATNRMVFLDFGAVW